MSQKNKFAKTIWRDDTGAALITLLVISLLLILAAIAYMSGNSKYLEKTTDNVLRKQAADAANGGIDYAQERLKSAAEWTKTGWSEVMTNPTLDGAIGYVTVTFSDYDQESKTATITANSDFKGRKVRRVWRVKAHQAKIVYPAAACASEKFVLTGNCLIDSYTSVSGPYSTDLATNNGNIGSNGTIRISGNANIKGRVIAAGDLSADGNACIHNDVKAGGNISMAGSADIQGNLAAVGNLSGEMESGILGDVILGGNADALQGSVSGNLKENTDPVPLVTPPCDCEAYDIAALVNKVAKNNNNGSCPQILADKLSLNSQESVTLSSGIYYLTALNITGNARVFLDGEVVIVLDGAGPFNLSGNGIINPSKNIKDLAVYSNSGGTIKLSGNNSFAGTIYAPHGKVLRIGNTEFYGSILAKVINVGGSAGLHYDTSLAGIGGGKIAVPGVVDVEIQNQ